MKQRELTVALCIIWAVTLLYGEMVAFWLPSYWSCSSWPHLHRPKSPSTSSMMDSATNGSDYVKIAVITDPQLMDRTSLHLPPKSLALETAEFYTDLYMRRAFLASILPLKPDVILFLGDYFDGGPYLSDEEWQESLSRFKHIFSLNTQRAHANIQVYYLPGNHDIGYEILHSYRPEVIGRYEKEFGVRNYQFTVGKVEFVVIDAQTLDGRPQGNLVSSSWEFIKNVTRGSVSSTERPQDNPISSRDFIKNVTKGQPHGNLISSWEFFKNVTKGQPQGNVVSLSWEFVENVTKGRLQGNLISSSWEVIKNVTKGQPQGNVISSSWEFIKNVTKGQPQGNNVSSPREFIKNVTKDDQLYPRVLLTHIPLYRRDGTYCGPSRNSLIINQRVLRTVKEQEIWYQNYVTEESSNLLLDMIKPVLVLSGHDHDQCTVIHNSKPRPVKEHTLGTISWQQGNLYPSFMLLSATNNVLPNTSNPEEAVITQLCFLPMQTHIYIWYLSLFVFTLLVLLFLPTSGISFWDQIRYLLENSKQLISTSIFRYREKEKNEDLKCEYDMMWDVEGSMHLIKRTLNDPVTRSCKTNLLERGNALMRPSARRNISGGSGISFDVDSTEDVGIKHTMKLPSRAFNSWRKIIIQRLVRTFCAISIIAAVNIPLYMILLFKDWMD